MSPPLPIDPQDQPVWGCEAIAAVLNMTPKRAEHLLRAGLIDADKFGGRWVSTPRRLQNQFAGTCTTPAAAPHSRTGQQSQ